MNLGTSLTSFSERNYLDWLSILYQWLILVFLSIIISNEASFLRLFEQRIRDNYLQEWFSQVRNTSDYRLFKKIKSNFEFEKYLSMDNKLFRISITKVRLSSHLFYIERGRWEKQKVDAINRKCELCNTIEDEFHCLVECPRFKEVRKNASLLIL